MEGIIPQLHLPGGDLVSTG